MICKFCKKTIEDDSIFCRFCGEKVVRTRKKKEEVKVPPPVLQPSGKYMGRVMVNGQRVTITEATEAAYYVRARAIKSGMIKAEKKPEIITLKQACDEYVASRTAVLSPSTITGYNNIIRTRYKDYMPDNVYTIDYQQMVNDEVGKGVSPKTIINSYAFIRSVLKEKGVPLKEVRLPQKEKKDLPWLNYEQIQLFIDSLHGRECELGALLALHGLRRSEVLAVTPEKIHDGKIHVEGAVVRTDDGYVFKKTNKNSSSTRAVPVLIPRLEELLKQNDYEPGKPVVKMSPDALFDNINRICTGAGIPRIGIHGLRRSFVSLCYHLKLSEAETMRLGGYDDWATMRKIYTKLSENDASEGVDKLKAYFGSNIGSAT